MKTRCDWRQLCILLIPTAAFCIDDLPPTALLRYLCFFFSLFTLSAYLRRKHPTEDFPLWFWGCAVWLSSVYFFKSWHALQGDVYQAAIGPIKVCILGLALIRFRSGVVLFAVSLMVNFADPAEAVVAQICALSLMWYGYFARLRSGPPTVSAAPTHRFAIGVFAVVLCYVLYHILLNPLQHWVHPEVSEEYYITIASRLGGGWTRWLDVFDMRVFDVLTWSRPRFISNFFMMLDTYVRVLVPSVSQIWAAFSVTWLLSLTLTPLLLFVYLSRTWGKTAAYCGCALFLTSCGYLSGGTFRFHPGKPLSSLALIALLLIAQHLERKLREQKRFTTKEHRLFLGLLTLQLLSFFLDETALFSFFLIPWLHPSVYFSQHRAYRYAPLAPLAAYLGTITWVVPALCRAYHFAPFDFWKLSISENSGLDRIARNALVNLVHQLRIHLSYPLFEGKSFLGVEIVGQIVAMATLVIAVRVVVLQFSDVQKRRFARTLGATLLFILFYSVLLSRHGGTFATDYYYGGMASILFAITLAGIFQLNGRSALRVEGALLVVMLLGKLTLFERTNRAWLLAHVSDTISFTHNIGKTEAWSTQMSERRLPSDNWILQETKLRLFPQRQGALRDRYPRQKKSLRDRKSVLGANS